MAERRKSINSRLCFFAKLKCQEDQQRQTSGHSSLPSLRLTFSMLRMLVAEAPSWSSLEPVDGVLLVRSRVSASSELLSPSSLFVSLGAKLFSGFGSSQRGIWVIPSWFSCSMKYSMISFPCGSVSPLKRLKSLGWKIFLYNEKQNNVSPCAWYLWPCIGLLGLQEKASSFTKKQP